MHQEKEHKAPKYTHMHEPPEKVLPQYPYLQDYIKEKDPQQGEDLHAEQRRYNTLDGRRNPC